MITIEVKVEDPLPLMPYFPPNEAAAQAATFKAMSRATLVGCFFFGTIAMGLCFPFSFLMYAMTHKVAVELWWWGVFFLLATVCGVYLFNFSEAPVEYDRIALQWARLRCPGSGINSDRARKLFVTTLDSLPRCNTASRWSRLLVWLCRTRL